MTVAHWDEVEPIRRDVGDMRATFRRLGAAAGAHAVGVARIDVEPGCRAGPVHVHGSEEEIFFVLEGSGLTWLDGAVHEIAVGDTIVYLAGGPEHTVIAGDAGLSVLAFGENHQPIMTRLPRAGVGRRRDLVLELTSDDPLQRELAAGPLGLPEPTTRPSCIVALEDVELEREEVNDVATVERDVARAANSVRTGLRYNAVPAGKLNCPPHWHGVEEELFVVLEGGGALELYDNRGEVVETHDLRVGSCVARPERGRRRLAHALRGGPDGMTYLAYGMREQGEIVYYPRSRKAWLSGVMVRLELADDYWEGEG